MSGNAPKHGREYTFKCQKKTQQENARECSISAIHCNSPQASIPHPSPPSILWQQVVAQEATLPESSSRINQRDGKTEAATA